MRWDGDAVLPPEGARPSCRLGRRDRGGGKHSHQLSTSSSPGTGNVKRLGAGTPSVKLRDVALHRDLPDRAHPDGDPRGGTGPAGSSTTNDAVPGKRWFCQFDAVPKGQRMLWYGYVASCANRRAVGMLRPHARTNPWCWWNQIVICGRSCSTSAPSSATPARRAGGGRTTGSCPCARCAPSSTGSCG